MKSERELFQQGETLLAYRFWRLHKVPPFIARVAKQRKK